MPVTRLTSSASCSCLRLTLALDWTYNGGWSELSSWRLHLSRSGFSIVRWHAATAGLLARKMARKQSATPAAKRARSLLTRRAKLEASLLELRHGIYDMADHRASRTASCIDSDLIARTYENPARLVERRYLDHSRRCAVVQPLIVTAPIRAVERRGRLPFQTNQ